MPRSLAIFSQGGSSTTRLVREEREQADRHVDEKDPAPAEIVGDPAAERGPDGGRDDHGHAVNGEGHAALFAGKRVGEDGLFAGLQSAAARALQHAEEDQHAQARWRVRTEAS